MHWRLQMHEPSSSPPGLCASWQSPPSPWHAPAGRDAPIPVHACPRIARGSALQGGRPRRPGAAAQYADCCCALAAACARSEQLLDLASAPAAQPRRAAPPSALGAAGVKVGMPTKCVIAPVASLRRPPGHQGGNFRGNIQGGPDSTAWAPGRQLRTSPCTKPRPSHGVRTDTAHLHRHEEALSAAQ